MVLSGTGQLPCHHKMVIGEITRSHQLVTRLKSLVLPSPPASGRCSPELSSDLFDEVLQSYKVSISMLLRPCNCYSEPADVKSSEDIRALEEEEKNNVKEQRERIDISYAPDSRKESQSKTSTTSNLHLYGHQWRKSGKKKTSNGEIPREEQQSWTTITAAPHLDGHQWRKYGEKHISNSEFPRNYYRCSHFKEKKCQATKTVQQKEGGGDRIRFVVAYKMHHTCKSMDPTYPLLVESATQEDSVEDSVISFAAEDNPPRKKVGGSSAVPMLIDLNLTVQS